MLSMFSLLRSAGSVAMPQVPEIISGVMPEASICVPERVKRGVAITFRRAKSFSSFRASPSAT